MNLIYNSTGRLSERKTLRLKIVSYMGVYNKSLRQALCHLLSQYTYCLLHDNIAQENCQYILSDVSCIIMLLMKMSIYFICCILHNYAAQENCQHISSGISCMIMLLRETRYFPSAASLYDYVAPPLWDFL